MADGANTSDMPVPAMMNGAIRLAYGVSGAEIAASQNSAIDCSARPATISGRAPIRSLSSPAIGATIIGTPVQGSVRRPASKGE